MNHSFPQPLTFILIQEAKASEVFYWWISPQVYNRQYNSQKEELHKPFFFFGVLSMFSNHLFGLQNLSIYTRYIYFFLLSNDLELFFIIGSE